MIFGTLIWSASICVIFFSIYYIINKRINDEIRSLPKIRDEYFSDVTEETEHTKQKTKQQKSKDKQYSKDKQFSKKKK
jgi:predicted PurR-regulated permease PerM